MTAFLFATVVVAVLGVRGAAKVASAGPAAADRLGVSVGEYRLFGVLEIVGAAGVAGGLAVPLLGLVSGLLVIVMMLGAAVAHLISHDGVWRCARALLIAVLVAAYLAALG